MFSFLLGVCTPMLLAKLLAFGGHGFPGGDGREPSQRARFKASRHEPPKSSADRKKNTSSLKTVEAEARKKMKIKYGHGLFCSKSATIYHLHHLQYVSKKNN